IVVDVQPAHVVDLPGQRGALEQFVAGEFDEVPRVVVLAVPIHLPLGADPGFGGSVAPADEAAPGELADEYRRAPLGKKQEREGGGENFGSVERGGADGEVAVAALLAEKVLAPFAVPVVLADEALAGEAAEPFDAVDVVSDG